MDDLESQPKTELFDPKKTPILLLAGGPGERMKKSGLSEHKLWPKPLIRTGGSGSLTLLDTTLRGLKKNKFNNWMFLTSKDPAVTDKGLIEAHVRAFYKTDNSVSGNINFSVEKKRLGTAGAAYKALINIGSETAVITPVDTAFPWEKLKSAIESHKENDSNFTWVVTSNPGENTQNVGRILVSPTSGKVIHNLEGTSLKREGVDPECKLEERTSVGVVVVNPEYYKKMFNKYKESNKEKEHVDIYRDLIPYMLAENQVIDSFDVRQPAPDLGTPERLTKHQR